MTYKLLSYSADGGPRAGVFIEGRVYDAEALTGNARYGSMQGILDDWAAADALLAGLSEKSHEGGKELSQISLLAPLPRPGQIWAAGANYQDHIGEMAESEYKAINAKTISGGRPWHFVKSSRSVIAAQSLPANGKVPVSASWPSGASASFSLRRARSSRVFTVAGGMAGASAVS